MSSLNDYQQQVKQSVELLFDAANRNSGRVLDAGAVRRICTYIQNLVNMIETKDIALLGADSMLSAYIEEYGEGLMDTLMDEDGFEYAEVIGEGEEVSDGFDEEETGSEDEDAGVDASEEE